MFKIEIEEDIRKKWQLMTKYANLATKVLKSF